MAEITPSERFPAHPPSKTETRCPTRKRLLSRASSAGFRSGETWISPMVDASLLSARGLLARLLLGSGGGSRVTQGSQRFCRRSQGCGLLFVRVGLFLGFRH